MFKKGSNKDIYEVRILNVLAVVATKAISETLWNYLAKVNVPEGDRKFVKMKNEFFYSTVIVTFAKKSYVGYLLRKESAILKKPKIDVKGLSFFKSTSTASTSNFIYQNLLMGQLFKPEDGKISLTRIYKSIVKFQEKMHDEIVSGDMSYLKRSKVKSPDAYTNPLRIGQYKAVYAWNYVNDEKDRISTPATVVLVKVVLRDKKDIAKLDRWPKIYERMMRLFETDPEFGDHVEVKNGKERLIKGKGIKAIAIPIDYEEVPEWLLAIIDVQTLVNNNMKLFEQLNLALGFTPGTTTHNKSTMKYYTNVIRI